ncbi:MAG: monovalent cation/H(+) antiporter subunit G [Rhodospirillales bacterium]
MDMILDLLSWAFLMGGAALCLIGAIGILRLPDIYSRIHGAGIVDTLGTLLVVLGLLLQAPHWIIAVKLVLIFIFIFFTSPTTTHALCRATLNSGLMPKLGNDKGRKEALKAMESQPIQVTDYRDAEAASVQSAPNNGSGGAS